MRRLLRLALLGCAAPASVAAVLAVWIAIPPGPAVLGARPATVELLDRNGYTRIWPEVVQADDWYVKNTDHFAA